MAAPGQQGRIERRLETILAALTMDFYIGGDVSREEAT
jgi:hypothetical protein